MALTKLNGWKTLGFEKWESGRFPTPRIMSAVTQNHIGVFGRSFPYLFPLPKKVVIITTICRDKKAYPQE